MCTTSRDKLNELLRRSPRSDRERMLAYLVRLLTTLGYHRHKMFRKDSRCGHQAFDNRMAWAAFLKRHEQR